jgi:hypothetical protein
MNWPSHGRKVRWFKVRDFKGKNEIHIYFVNFNSFVLQSRRCIQCVPCNMSRHKFCTLLAMCFVSMAVQPFKISPFRVCQILVWLCMLRYKVLLSVYGCMPGSVLDHLVKESCVQVNITHIYLQNVVQFSVRMLFVYDWDESFWHYINIPIFLKWICLSPPRIIWCNRCCWLLLYSVYVQYFPVTCWCK